MPAADEVMLYKAFNSLFNSLFKWKGSIFLPFLNSSLDIVAKSRLTGHTIFARLNLPDLQPAGQERLYQPQD